MTWRVESGGGGGGVGRGVSVLKKSRWGHHQLPHLVSPTFSTPLCSVTLNKKELLPVDYALRVDKSNVALHADKRKVALRVDKSNVALHADKKKVVFHVYKRSKKWNTST